VGHFGNKMVEKSKLFEITPQCGKWDVATLLKSGMF